MLPLHEVLLARPARKEAKKLEKAAKDLHDVICQSEPYKVVAALAATLQQIRRRAAGLVRERCAPSKRFGVDRAYLHEGLCVSQLRVLPRTA